MTRVVRAGAERIGELEPLWRALHTHHAEVARGEWAVRPVEDSWEIRRATYERWLAGTEAVLLLAERDGELVGYLMLTFGDPPATWDGGSRSAEVETMSVLPRERGSGTGSALLDAARELAREGGARSLFVGALHTNEGAIRFYERAGFRPFYLELGLDLE